MNSRDIIEWTLERVLNEGHDLLDDFYYYRNKCLDKLVEELEKEL